MSFAPSGHHGHGLAGDAVPGRLRAPARLVVFAAVLILHCALVLLLYADFFSAPGGDGSRRGTAGLNVFRVSGLPRAIKTLPDEDDPPALSLTSKAAQDVVHEPPRTGVATHDGAGRGDAALAQALAGALADPLAGGAADYDAVLRRHIARYARHPEGSGLNRRAGIVLVRFRVARDGQVVDARVLRTQGANLDEAALAALWRAEPLPHVPADLPAPLEVDVPIDFVARR